MIQHLKRSPAQRGIIIVYDLQLDDERRLSGKQIQDLLKLGDAFVCLSQMELLEVICDQIFHPQIYANRPA